MQGRVHLVRTASAGEYEAQISRIKFNRSLLTRSEKHLIRQLLKSRAEGGNWHNLMRGPVRMTARIRCPSDLTAHHICSSHTSPSAYLPDHSPAEKLTVAAVVKIH